MHYKPFLKTSLTLSIKHTGNYYHILNNNLKLKIKFLCYLKKSAPIFNFKLGFQLLRLKITFSRQKLYTKFKNNPLLSKSKLKYLVYYQVFFYIKIKINKCLLLLFWLFLAFSFTFFSLFACFSCLLLYLALLGSLHLFDEAFFRFKNTSEYLKEKLK